MTGEGRGRGLRRGERVEGRGRGSGRGRRVGRGVGGRGEAILKLTGIFFGALVSREWLTRILNNM